MSNSQVNKVLGAALLTMGFLASRQALADYSCQSQAEQGSLAVKILAVTLQAETSQEESLPLAAQPAAVLVKSELGTILLTGTVRLEFSRAGELTVYRLTDQEGEQAALRLNHYFQFPQCTRAGCPEPLETITGNLSYLGEYTGVACDPSPF